MYPQHFRRILVVLFLLAAFLHPVCAEEKDVEAKPRIESPSPDGQFAFRFSPESDASGKTYDLISRKSGKDLVRVAESERDPAPSARFNMSVSWRSDSKMFALTAMLWKRGRSVSVYVRDGATFREVTLPELEAEIPDKIKAGKEYPHIVELNSQSAKRWQKDGSLVVEIENMEDGNGGSITAKRTVVLGFDKAGQVKVLKSTIKFTVDKP